MIHERQQIRQAITGLLLNRTEAGPRVYPGEWTPQQRSTLPAISVAILTESPRDDSLDRYPREYFIVATVQIVVWQIRTEENTDIDDRLDSICREIECAVESDPRLCLECVEDVTYDGTQLTYDDRGERMMASAVLAYNVTYARVSSQIGDAAQLKDFRTGFAEFNQEGQQAPADRNSILFPTQAAIEFYGTTLPEQVTQYARGSITAAPTRFDIPDGRDTWTQFDPGEYAYARSDSFAHSSQLGASVPPPSINYLLKSQRIDSEPAFWPRTGLFSIPSTEVNNLFGSAILPNVFVDTPPGEYTQLVTGLPPGEVYTFSCWLQANTAGNDAELQMRDGVSGPVLGTTGVFAVTEDVLTQHFVTATVPASGEIEVAIRYLELTTQYRAPDSAQLEPGGVVTEFIPQIGGGPDVPVERAQTTIAFELNGDRGELTNIGDGPEVSEGFVILESAGNTVAKIGRS